MTKRKKELVELMYEAGIREFPKGGEFAAQDKNGQYADMVSFFYGAIPVFWRSADVWGDAGWCRYLINESVKLPQLCKNWHRTVVTREQYEEYCKMREREESSDVEAGDAVEDALIGEQPKPSILDMMRHCNELREIAITKQKESRDAVDAYTLAVRELESEVLALGYKIEPIDQPAEPQEVAQPLNITDWSNLQVGDVIECQPKGGWLSSFIGEQCTVKMLEHKRYMGSLPILALHSNGSEDWGRAFKFIRRP